MRINKIVATSVLSLATVGAMIAASTPGAGAAPAVHRAPSVHIADPSAKLVPNKNIVPGQTVTISVKNFPESDLDMPMYVFQCAAQALATQDQSYCDLHPEDGNNSQVFTQDPNDSNHVVGTSPYVVRAGSAFRATNPNAKCGFSAKAGSSSNTCYIVVSDTPTQTADTNVGFAPYSYKDIRGTSTTKIKAPKTLKAGKTLKIKITVKGSKSGSVAGKLTVTDNGKKISKKSISKSGVLKVKEKHVKKGKHKLAAKYAGNNSFKASSGKATVKVKK